MRLIFYGAIIGISKYYITHTIINIQITSRILQHQIYIR